MTLQTFKQFLAEAVGDPDLEDILRRDCSAFLNHGEMLYRGVQNPAKTDPIHCMFHDEELIMIKKEVRSDRRPRDTPRKIHVAMDDWFEKKFGERVRETGLFCAGEKGLRTVGEYGTPCAIFPIGNFKFYWSPKVDDLFVTIDNMPGYARETPEAFDEWMKDLRYTSRDFDMALASGHEIMLSCDSYYAIPLGSRIGLSDELRTLVHKKTWKR